MTTIAPQVQAQIDAALAVRPGARYVAPSTKAATPTALPATDRPATAKAAPRSNAAPGQTSNPIPLELRSCAPWLAWKSVPNPDGKKPRKLPIDPRTGKTASSTDPSTWADYDTAVSAVVRYGLAGPGVVFAPDGPYSGVDLDHCRDPQTRVIAPWAQEIIAELNSYTEVSPSGTGVKVFLKGKLPANAKHNVLYQTGSVEMYDSGRFFAVTGKHVAGTPAGVEHRQAELTEIYARIFGPAPQASPTATASGVTASKGIGKGQRTNRLVSLAGSMHKRGMTPEAIEAALLQENQAKCFPPLPEAKVKAIARDIPARYPNTGSEAHESAILRPDLIRLSDVQARAVSWLWEPFIPLGMLSMISGDPGSGKTFVAMSICADLTRGKLRDGRIVEPANVLYLSIENPIAETIRPRFDALGGDPARFFALRGTQVEIDGEEHKGSVTLSDVDMLDKAIAESGAKLVVIDPLQSYLGANVDLHRSNETRPVLDALSKLAEKHGCAILLLRHLSKQSGTKAIHRGLGSIDLTGAARSEMLVGSLPDDENTRAFCHIKSNIGRKGKTLGFSIDGEGRFSWTGESQITASDLLAAPEGPDRSKRERAQEWMSALLKSGSREEQEIRSMAELEGFSYSTLRRAKNALRIKSRKGTFGGSWIWSLPEDGPKDASDPDEGRLTV